MFSIVEILDLKIALLPFWVSLMIYLSVLSVIVAISLWRKWVTVSGAVAAFILGLFVLYIGGFTAFIILLFFFVAGSLMGKVCKSFNPFEKKSGKRDMFQVMANGLPALIGLLIFKFSSHQAAALVAYSSALAEALADTWAGDFGCLSRKDPVSIITRTKVPKGISGGVTALGFMGALIASMLIAMLYVGYVQFDFIGGVIVVVCGFLGAVVDSILGATIQVQYRDARGSLTEKGEVDGKKLERVRGIPFIDNDMVNFLSGLFAMSISYGFAMLLG